MSEYPIVLTYQFEQSPNQTTTITLEVYDNRIVFSDGGDAVKRMLARAPEKATRETTAKLIGILSARLTSEERFVGRELCLICTLPECRKNIGDYIREGISHLSTCISMVDHLRWDCYEDEKDEKEGATEDEQEDG